MAPLYWIFGLIAVGYIFFDIMNFEKNPEQYTKKKRKFLRSPSNPVASNAELFDAFDNKLESKENNKDKESNN